MSEEALCQTDEILRPEVEVRFGQVLRHKFESLIESQVWVYFIISQNSEAGVCSILSLLLKATLKKQEMVCCFIKINLFQENGFFFLKAVSCGFVSQLHKVVGEDILKTNW